MKLFVPSTPLPVLMPVPRQDLNALNEAIPWRVAPLVLDARPTPHYPTRADTR